MISWNCKILGILILTLLNQKSFAQYSLHLIADVPAGTKDVYVAGTFNNWNPGDKNYRLTPVGMHREIVLRNLKAGKCDFRFTRGNFKNEECSATGTVVRTRGIIISKDTSIQVKIPAWSGDYFDISNMADSTLYEVMMNRAGYYLDISLDSSYKYAQHLHKVSQKLGSPIKQARAFDLQGVIFTKQGNGEKALELFFRSLSIKKALNDSSGISFIYHGIGEVYESLQDLSKAKECYLLSVNWTEKRFKSYKSVPLTNLAAISLQEGHSDSAFSYVNQALQLNNKFSRALLLMGDIQMKAGKNNLALEYYQKTALPRSSLTNVAEAYTSVAEAYKKMAEVFYKTGRKDSAIFYARKGFALAVEVNNPHAIISTSSLLSKIYEMDRRFDSAFLYQQIVLQKKDTLFTAEKEKQIHNIYFNEKLRQQELEAQNKQYRAQIKIYILSAAVLLLLLIGASYRARLRSRFYKQLAEIEMRALRAQMNPHFIFNCLASINRYIVKNETKTASGYLTRFSKLIRLILDNSSSAFIPIDAEIQTLKLYLEMESLRFNHSFAYELEVDQVLRADNTGIPAMIIQPYIENAIWHGLMHKPEKGKLLIRFQQLSEDKLWVEIEDNGIGRKKAAGLRSKDSIKTKSYGMQISKDRIRIINTQYPIKSSVTIEDLSDEAGEPTGTRVTLHLPLIEMTANSPLFKADYDRSHNN